MIALCLSPVAMKIYLEDQHNKQRKQKLTQVFNEWRTPEAFRPYIERVVIDKTATCEDIPLNPDSDKQMSLEESQFYVEVCESARSRIAAEYEFDLK